MSVHAGAYGGVGLTTLPGSIGQQCILLPSGLVSLPVIELGFDLHKIRYAKQVQPI